MVSEKTVKGWPERAKAGGNIVVADPVAGGADVTNVFTGDVASIGYSGPKKIIAPTPDTTI